MLEPMARAGTAGYVPLCAAIPWIMTNGGSLVKQLKDEEAWNVSIARLLPLISIGEVEIIGRHHKVAQQMSFKATCLPASQSEKARATSVEQPSMATGNHFRTWHSDAVNLSSIC